jgi:hypothetical protein
MNQQGLTELKQLLQEIEDGTRTYTPHPAICESNPIATWKVVMDMEKLGIKPDYWILPLTVEGIPIQQCLGIRNLNRLPNNPRSCIEYAAKQWALTRVQRWQLLAGKWWLCDVKEHLKEIEEEENA